MHRFARISSHSTSSETRAPRGLEPPRSRVRARWPGLGPAPVVLFATGLLASGQLGAATEAQGAALPELRTVDLVLTPNGPVVAQDRDDTPLDDPTELCWNNSNVAPHDPIKACLGTGVVRAFTLGYRTTAVDVADGGPGADLTVAFYQNTEGLGSLGTEQARYRLSGLPGTDASGQPRSFELRVDLGDFPFCLDDGAIGVGFVSEDGLTQPLVTSAPDASLGTQNLLDHYSPAPATSGSYVQTFNFGAGKPYASLYARLYEDDGSTKASATIVNGTGVNPVIFTELAPAILGKTWLTNVDLTSYPNANFTIVVLTANPPLVVPTPYGELLVDVTDPGAITSLSLGVHAQDVPKDTFILGQTFHSQAAVFRVVDPLVLTNGIDVLPGF